MKVLFYFLTATVMTVCLSSCGPKMIPIPGSNLCLVASDQPEYGKYQLFFPERDRRISPPFDTAYVVWDKIIGITKYDKCLFSCEDAHFMTSADEFYFIEFSESGQEHQFIIYKLYESGRLKYFRCTKTLGWRWEIGKGYYDAISSLPKQGSKEPENYMIRLSNKDLQKNYGVVEDLLYYKRI